MNDKHLTPIAQLLKIMAQLRDPEGGCAWDLEQTWASIAPHTIEEAYEVADAINNGDAEAVLEELGDLLLQVVFQARIAEENGLFDFDSVASSIGAKMIRRHPNIFGSDRANRTSAEQRQAWEDAKAAERVAENPSELPQSELDGIATTLPPMMRAVKLQQRASRVGFDWPNAESVIEKIEEELAEVKSALGSEELAEVKTAKNTDTLEGEIGDVLFAVINLARKSGIDPSQALTQTNDKFINRFKFIEAEAQKANKPLNSIALDEMEQWWQSAKDTSAADTSAKDTSAADTSAKDTSAS